jgi:hypothetical protein
MGFERSVETMELLGSGQWFARVSGRVIGRDATARTRELRADNLDGLLDDIREFFHGVMPQPAAPVRKGCNDG